MEDRGAEGRPEIWNLVAPLRREAVFAQRLVLGADLDALLDIRCQAQAPGSPEAVSGERLEAIER